MHQKRSSIHPSISRGSQKQSTPISTILPAKALELHGLEQVKEASGELLERVEGLADEAHKLAQGGEAVGKVLGVWEELFSVIRLMGSVSGNQQGTETATATTTATMTATRDGDGYADQNTDTETQKPIEKLVTIIFPPAAVGFISGCSCDLLINIGLCLLGYLPGHIHAFWLIYKRMAAEEQYGYKGFKYLGNGKYESVEYISQQPQHPPPAYGATENA
ncbi:hypothetical protein E3P77_02896 [Wallemia ichthyophaga]|nr:hypothetical protein E3P77_02896 [Wallemia ichthyophaga]